MNAYAVTGTGKQMSWEKVMYCLQDLFEYGYLTSQQFYNHRYWVRMYECGMGSPVQLFWDPFSADMVCFPWMLEGLYQMYQNALHYEDLRDEIEDELIGRCVAEVMNDEVLDVSLGVFQLWPINIGRFSYQIGSPVWHNDTEIDGRVNSLGGEEVIDLLNPEDDAEINAMVDEVIRDMQN